MNSLKLTGKCLLYAFCALLMLVALALAGARVAVFYIHDYKEQIAAIAGNYLGSPVQIDDIELVWNRFDARASLTGVRIKSAIGAQTRLVLPRLELQLNARDILLQRKLTVRNVSLHGLSLVTAYEGSGQITVQGYRRQPGENRTTQSADSRGASALQWLFNAESIAILDSEILLQDKARNREYKLDQLNIRAFNEGNQHRIRINSTLPNELGDVSVAAFDFTGTANDIKGWAGRFYLNGAGLDLQELTSFAGFGDKQITGLADAQLWGGWKGTRLTDARAVVAGTPLFSVAEETALIPATIAVDVDWRRTSEGWEAGFSELSAAFDDGAIDLAGLDVHLEKHAGSQREMRIAGPGIDLFASQALWQVAESILPTDLPPELGSLRGGKIDDWLIGLSRQQQSFELQTLIADISNVDTVASGYIPGVSGLGGSVFYREGVGRLVFPQQQVQLDTTTLTGYEIPPVSIAGTLRYAAGNDRWNIVGDDFRVETADFATRSSLQLHKTRTGMLPITLQTRLLGGDLASARRYYPRPFIKPSLYEWLQTAIISGELLHGQLDLKGNLADFSPVNGRGTISGQLKVRDGTLKYLDDWPVVEGLDATVFVDANRLHAVADGGTIRQTAIDSGEVTIDSYVEPIVAVKARGGGPVAGLLEFLQNGPLVDSVGQYLGDAQGSGDASLDLDLRVPLRGPVTDELVVNGSVSVDDAWIEAREYGLKFENVAGELGFTRDGVDTDNLVGRYLGIPVNINAVRRQVGNVKTNSVFLNGPVSVANVLRSYGIELPPTITGVSPWQVQLDVRQPVGRDAEVLLTASSNLQGATIVLPAPLTKPASEPLDTTVSVNFSTPDRDWWIRIPELIEARIRVGDDQQVESMAFALGGSSNTVLPWRGIAINGDVDVLDAVEWVEFALEIDDSSDTAAAAEAFPLFANVHATNARVGSQLFGKMHYSAFRDGTHQVHRVDNAFVAGELLQRKTSDESEPLLLQLEWLDKAILAAMGEDETDTDNVTERPLDPREIPPFDVAVKKLKWDNWRLSRVSLRARPEDYGMAITGLSARERSMRLSGSGRWLVRGQDDNLDHVTSLDVNSTFDDLGRAVEDVGGGKTLAAGTGEMALSLRWPGPAYSPDLETIAGQLFFNLRNGRILTVDPGAGRILGLFALQALPRRLTLDFRDLYKTGLEFQTVNGNFSIQNGIASTESLLLSGPVAEILVRGHTDFVRQLYDQKIDVLPRVSAALPFLGILSGGAAVGVTALVADEILKGVGLNLDEVGRRTYALSGSWEQPDWRVVPRESAARPAATE